MKKKIDLSKVLKKIVAKLSDVFSLFSFSLPYDDSLDFIHFRVKTKKPCRDITKM